MARASELVSQSSILSAHPLLTFRQGRYSYKIERKADQSIYSVTDGQETITVPIGWAFGAGRIGQTYIFQNDGEFYEARVSYFSTINALDITIGHERQPPPDLLRAAGRHLGKEEIVRCFFCHTTGGADKRQLTLDTMLSGVRCVHCHTAAPQHLAGLSEGELHLDEMQKLADLSAEGAVSFCGQCHRSPEDVLDLQLREINTVRFQPYRLVLSKCYDPQDGRISCLACHDPHQELSRDQTHYDSKCLACHDGRKPRARRCQVAKKDCATCHMPKLELPDSHHYFSDHLIRVMRPSDSLRQYQSTQNQ